MVLTACLVCFISTVNGCSNKKKNRKEEAYSWKAGASSGHITNLKQSILETFNIYATVPMEQRALKNVSNCLNINIDSYLAMSGGQSSNLYLNVVHFFNTNVN
jgi:hypothetical protein